MLYQMIHDAEAGVTSAVLWKGEKINGVSHPRNIAQLWTAEELAAVGLYHPVQAPSPEPHKNLTKEFVGIRNNVPTVVREYEDKVYTHSDVKKEANARIEQLYPSWKQDNHLAECVIMLMGIVVQEATPTEKQLADVTAALEAFAEIKRIRAASDVLEGMEEVPTDYAADERWS